VLTVSRPRDSVVGHACRHRRSRQLRSWSGSTTRPSRRWRRSSGRRPTRRSDLHGACDAWFANTVFGPLRTVGPALLTYIYMQGIGGSGPAAAAPHQRPGAGDGEVAGGGPDSSAPGPAGRRRTGRAQLAQPATVQQCRPGTNMRKPTQIHSRANAANKIGIGCALGPGLRGRRSAVEAVGPRGAGAADLSRRVPAPLGPPYPGVVGRDHQRRELGGTPAKFCERWLGPFAYLAVRPLLYDVRAQLMEQLGNTAALDDLTARLQTHLRAYINGDRPVGPPNEYPSRHEPP